jgi:hypothetical protein
VVGRVLRRVNVPVSVVNYPASEVALNPRPGAGGLQLHPTP